MSDTLYDAIIAAGYAPPEIIHWDGKLHRFATSAEKPYSKDGWYVAHDDAQGKAAAFGSWRDGASYTWSNGTGRRLTEEEKAAIEAQKKRALAEDKKRRNQAALRARRIYDELSSEVTSSPYLERKGIQCPEGVRAVHGVPCQAFGFAGDWLVNGLIVPMRDRSGKIKNLQLILDEGRKLFMKDAQAASCFHMIGNIEGAARILVGEGLATVQSAHEATGCPALVAFSAGNLPDVTEIARDINATAEIIILGDDDEAGRMKAAEAAHRARGRAVFPGHGCNDFNDLHTTHGLEAVKRAILDAPATQAEHEDIEWRADLIVKHKDDGSQVIPCRVHNLILILSHAPEFKGRVAFNEFTMQVAIDGKDLDDIGPVKIKAQLEKEWIKEKVPTSDVVEALAVVAAQRPFHPIREYLTSLTWDGVERIPDFFPDFFGCPKDEYHIAVAHSLFLSSVARIFKPGAKVDTMVILQSDQGMGKTRTWPALFGEKWCAEVTSSLNDKDFFSGLRGVWCADFGELDQFTKAEVTRIKQVLTQTFDYYRPHYGRQHQRFPRQCIFVGGTNQDNWQKDATGARRYL
ncbi:MAG: VapE domain-containing protein, partial [Candidatus Roseilinea sp.]|uniref:VapE domain-containing protein n=1 Tax=Candidatus Roseilinea sp. TaxID=2838777 RepID=UPI004049844A